MDELHPLMCTRYTVTDTALRGVAALLGAGGKLAAAKGETFPGDAALVALREKGGVGWRAARFGMCSSHGKNLVLNARSETALEKPMFRPAVQNGRAVVPAHSFFEWTRTAPKTKYEFYSPGGAPLLMAALVRREGDEWRYVVLTRAAAPPLSEIHDRQPLLLNAAEAREWLLDDESAPGLLAAPPAPLAMRRVELPPQSGPQQMSLL